MVTGIAHAAYAVEIPGEQTLSRSIVPPVMISLPLQAATHKGKNAFCALWLLFLGAPTFFLAILVAPAAFGGSFANQHIILSVLTWFFMLFAGMIGTSAALTCITDTLRKAPVLIIDDQAFRDTRSGLSVRWQDIKRATLLESGSGIVSVDLHLRRPMRAWQNPFRIGILGFRSYPVPDRLIISVAFLDMRPHVLAYTILALTNSFNLD